MSCESHMATRVHSAIDVILCANPLQALSAGLDHKGMTSCDRAELAIWGLASLLRAIQYFPVAFQSSAQTHCSDTVSAFLKLCYLAFANVDGKSGLQDDIHSIAVLINEAMLAKEEMALQVTTKKMMIDHLSQDVVCDWRGRRPHA